jgi:phosphonate ABC transporter permease subunit PhnE
VALYAIFVALCVATLASRGELTFGREPLRNLQRTAADLSRPSFLDVWFGNPRLEYRADDGAVLRVEDRRAEERKFLSALARAVWITLVIATLGTLAALFAALPLAVAAARNLGAPTWLRLAADGVLNVCRSIHTLVFGLLFVGIFGLGPVAGILAVAAHSLGTLGKLFAEAIETLDMEAAESVRAAGANGLQTFFTAIWPAALPQLVSTILYVWEFNIRDSTVLGLVGAGGLGLLISESMSLFQWGRLATLFIALVAVVMLFDQVSRRIRLALV